MKDINMELKVSCADIINHSLDGIIVLDSSGVIRLSNQAAERIFGIPSDQLAGQSFGMPVVGDDFSEIEIVSKNGPIRLAEIRTSEIFVDGQKWTICSLKDVSVRKVTEQLNLAIETANLGLWEWHSKTNLAKYDTRMGEILDLESDPFVETFEDWQSRIHPEDFSQVMECWNAHARGLTPSFEMEYRILTGADSYKPILDRARVSSRDMDGAPLRVLGAVMDMTEHQQALEAEQISSVKYRALVDNIPIGMMYVNKHGELIHCNRTFRQIFRLTTSEQAKPVNVFENKVFVQSGLNQLLHESFLEATELSSEVTYSPRKGKALCLKCVIQPISDLEGEVVGLQGLVEDITGQKQAQKMILDNEKLKAIADLASGVAHNFNNLLQLIVGSVSVALGHLERGNTSELRHQLEKALDNAKLGAGTVRRLQDFASISVSSELQNDETFDLSQVVNNAIEMSRPWWKTNAQLKGISIDLGRDLSDNLLVRGHKDDLFEVTMNLIKNAAEAMPQGGRLTVSTKPEKDNALLIVQDSGVGIPKGSEEKIFQPFWTTKGYQSCGLGLPSSLGIVRRYGGSISVTSRRGEATRFTVTLPLCGISSLDASVASGHNHENLRILCVDDDVPILEVLKEGLEMYGHEAETATNGFQAIEIYKRRHFDVIICDLGMPEMTGWEVGTEVKKLCSVKGIPKTPFFLLTGWGGQTESKLKILESGVDAVFTKPVSLSDLLKLIGRHLHQTRPGDIH